MNIRGILFQVRSESSTELLQWNLVAFCSILHLSKAHIAAIVNDAANVTTYVTVVNHRLTFKDCSPTKSTVSTVLL